MYTLYTGFPNHPDCDDVVDTQLKTCLDGIPEEQLQYDYHPFWATMLLVPFLLNYFASWYAWYRVDKKKQITWLACVFNLYPQLRAASIIRDMWNDPKRGLSRKRKFEREISEAEVFLEAVPTTFIMTYMRGRFIGGYSIGNVRAGILLGIFSDNLFRFTFLTSFITAGLGMAKVLKVGVCKILPSDKGLLGGFLSIRFILVFFACLFTLFSKAIFFFEYLKCPISNHPVISTILAFPVLTLPGLITGMIFIWHSSLLKTFISHPSLLLLPMFTFFSFESNTQCCCSNRNSQSEVEITFSVKATFLNLLVSLASVIVYTIIVSKDLCMGYRELTDQLILLTGPILTVILLFTICSSSCCMSGCSFPSASNSSCFSSSAICSSCISSCSASFFPPLEFGIYLPSSPCKVFIKDQTQPYGRKEIKEMEEESKVLQIVESFNAMQN